jgi:putative membrane-bound dehydrogenase-like protein
MKRSLLIAALALPFVSLDALAEDRSKAPTVPAEIPPQIEVLQPGVKLTLLAEHPELVTPTGISVDRDGRIWLVACHTHFRPEGYAGPAHDEILVFDKNGENRRVFYNKTNATMHVEIGPDGWVYLAERSRILRVKDTNGDGVGDLEENIATLDTLADYPHNGLSGMAWHPDGGLVFSLGENFGKDWTLTAHDGSKVSGRGEGGVFRCTADGRNIRRIARGFWNPFGLLVRSDGEIFAADNDPGSRPPCRLLSIVEGADYGFQWVYGSAPVHPFVAWNGELRGTLGMVHPSGEAPCAVMELGGGVMIPSWSNHCIDYFPLTRKGAGYTSQRIELLRGSDFFRPTCMAAGPNGAFYLNDWVFSSYPIHGRGRLWKLEIDKSKATWMKPAPEPLNDAARLAKDLREGKAKRSTAQLLELARGRDAFLSDAALTALARASKAWTTDSLKAMPASDRVWALVALRRVSLSDEKWVRALFHDSDPEVRFECLRWIADAVLTGFSAEVEQLLADPTLDFRLFEAALATWNTLRGDPGAGVTNPAVLVERITNPATPAKLKGYALRLAPATHPKITVPLLRGFFSAGDPVLSVEAVRTLAARNADDARTVLAEIAADESHSAELRAEAITGLAISTKPEQQALLAKLAASNDASLRDEARRALRFTEHDKSFAINQARPAFEDTAAWLKLLDALPRKPDAEAGRRIFFHPKLALCATCHRHSGRGNVVGPDLSLIAQQGDRTAILRSILEPQREVAPQFYPALLKLSDGTDFTGILLRSSSTEVFRDITGKERTFQKADIVQRTELKTSLMPPGLVSMLTDGELRDLLAFLLGGAPR